MRSSSTDWRVAVTSVFEMAVEALASGPLDGGDYARGLRDRAALAIGKFFEKQNQTAARNRVLPAGQRARLQ